MKTPIKTFKEIWESRNPQHEINSNTGEDMFWETAELVAKEYRNQSHPALTEDQITDFLYKRTGKLVKNDDLDLLSDFQSHLLSQEGKEEPKPKEVTDDMIESLSCLYRNRKEVSGYSTYPDGVKQHFSDGMKSMRDLLTKNK